MDIVGVAKAWDEVCPEEGKHCQQLIERAPEQQVEHVYIPLVLQTLLFDHIHQSCWNL